jgi:hypothetical protein
MKELFSENVYTHTEITRRSLQEAIANAPCAEIEELTVEAALERYAEGALLKEPILEPEPDSKELDDSGSTAVYRHKVENERSLRFAPGSLQFGGWPFQHDLGAGSLVIRFRADENPPPKERHAAIIKQILGNIKSLKSDIDRHNSFVRHTVETSLQERKEHCKKIAQRRSDL